MTQLARIKVNWTGFVGAPGYTNLYFRDPGSATMSQSVVNAAITATDTWLGAWVSSIPQVVNFVIDPNVEVIDENNGSLVALFTGTPSTTRAGSQTGNYSAASGAVVNWKTIGIRNGRVMRGRTFMVPLAATAQGPDGSLDATKLASLRTATATFISSFGTAALVVWGRPTTSGGTDGVSAAVTGFNIPDFSAVLRSRRD